MREVLNPRPRTDSRGRQAGHLSDVLWRGSFPVGGALTHHEQSQRVMGHLSGDVDVVRQAVDGVEIFLERLPRPGQAFVQHRAGQVLDPSINSISCA